MIKKRFSYGVFLIVKEVTVPKTTKLVFAVLVLLIMITSCSKKKEEKIEKVDLTVLTGNWDLTLAVASAKKLKLLRSEVTISQSEPDTITFGFREPGPDTIKVDKDTFTTRIIPKPRHDFTLKFDAELKKYKVIFNNSLEVPLDYSGSNSFNGIIKIRGTEIKVKIEIGNNKSNWYIAFPINDELTKYIKEFKNLPSAIVEKSIHLKNSYSRYGYWLELNKKE